MHNIHCCIEFSIFVEKCMQLKHKVKVCVGVELAIATTVSEIDCIPS